VFFQASSSAMAIDVDKPWYEDCPKEINNFHECQQYLESGILKKYPSLVSRNANQLKIKLSNERTKIISDIINDKDIDKSRVFSFIKYFPSIQYGLLYIQFSEGGSYDLIDMQTGTQTEVLGDAVLSPDNRRLAISFADVVAGFSSNVLAVYHILPVGLVLEFRVLPQEWGPVDLKWRDNRTIVFDKLICCDNLHDKKLTLRFLSKDISKNGKWSITK
jgi:hypothetical protein